MKETIWPIVLLDGGMGTTLTEPPLNIHFDETTPLWSSHLLWSDQLKLSDVHAAFAEAGADILLTATYQASEEGLERTFGSDYRQGFPFSVINSAVRLARNALEVARERPASRLWDAGFKTPSVALSLGPFGATLVPSQEYSGHYPPQMCSQQALKEWHSRRLVEFNLNPEYGPLEFIAFETLKRTDEVLAIREVMSSYQWQQVAHSRVLAADGKEQWKKKKWWISTVWPDEPEDGEIEEMVVALLDNADSSIATDLQESQTASTTHHLPAPWAIGVNCTGIEKVARIVQKMETCVTTLADSGRWHNRWSTGKSRCLGAASPAERPWLVLYPDGAKGLRYDSTTRDWIKTKDLEEDGVAWHEALWEIATAIRARGNWAGLILGGCCKTRPEHIRQLRRKLDMDAARG